MKSGHWFFRDRRPKPKLRTKGTGTARRQLEDRQGTGVTSLGTSLPPALGPKGYKRAKKVWPDT